MCGIEESITGLLLDSLSMEASIRVNCHGAAEALKQKGAHSVVTALGALLL